MRRSLLSILLAVFLNATNLLSMEEAFTGKTLDTILNTSLEELPRYFKKININGRFEDTFDTLLHVMAGSEEFSPYLKALLESKPEAQTINAKNARGVRPLYCAIEGGCPQIVKLLLEHGAKPDAMPGGIGVRQSPLSKALQLEKAYAHRPQQGIYTEIVAALRDKGAEVRAKGCMEQFLDAINRRKTLKIEWLLEIGADPNTLLTYISGDIENKCSPLHLCIKRGVSVRALLDKKADVNRADQNGDTPLHTALALKRDQALIEQLIKAGADVKARGRWGFTPLHYAYNRAIARFLLNKGAEVNAVTADQLTPLHQAVSHSRCDVAQLLLENGARINAEDKSGRTSLYIAAVETESLAMVKLLIDKYNACIPAGLLQAINTKILINKSNNRSQQDIFAVYSYVFGKYRAAMQDSEEPMRISEELQTEYEWQFIDPDNAFKDMPELEDNEESDDSELELGVPRSSSPQDLIINKMAASGSFNEQLETILKAGVSVNLQDPEGNTPLHSAVTNERFSVVELLLKNGANPNAEDKSGRTPLSIAAVENRNPHVVGLLLQHDALVTEDILNRVKEQLKEDNSDALELIRNQLVAKFKK